MEPVEFFRIFLVILGHRSQPQTGRVAMDPTYYPASTKCPKIRQNFTSMHISIIGIDHVKKQTPGFSVIALFIYF